MGGDEESQTLVTRLGDVSMATAAEGPSVSDPEALGETGHPSQPRAGYLGSVGFTAFWESEGRANSRNQPDSGDIPDRPLVL